MERQDRCLLCHSGGTREAFHQCESFDVLWGLPFQSIPKIKICAKSLFFDFLILIIFGVDGLEWKGSIPFHKLHIERGGFSCLIVP